jgi:acylphosphatase
VPVVHLEVSGRVQGVGFRWFTRQAARRLQLAGWVKNLPSGAVELAAAGPQEAIDRLLAQVRRGPDGAQVTGIRTLTDIAEEELPAPFSVLK